MSMQHLATIAETSNYERTGRLDEVARLADAYAAQWPDAVRAFEYGRSAHGRPMQALIASRAGSLSASELRERGVPIVLFQAGIHPGESDGKDSGFIVLRELLAAAPAESPLARVAVLFVPAFNADGHERFAAWNRPNQRGPLEMGWRATAQNLNLNRDYAKVDSPEMRAMLRLLVEWDPLLCVDLHVTDGADFQPDISLQLEPINQGDDALRGIGRELRDGVIRALEHAGSMPLAFYPDLAVPDDPSSGFALTVYSPRFSTGYFPYRNRFTLLVETHSWKPYAQRVRTTCVTLHAVAARLARDGRAWLAAAQAADRRSAALGGQSLVLEYATSWREPSGPAAAGAEVRTLDADAELIDFPGYAYTRTVSPVSGVACTTYDPTTPQIWRVPYRGDVEPSLTVALPRGGYLIPPEYAADLGRRLALHGIDTMLVERPPTGLATRTFRAASVQFSSAPFEGRQRATVSGEWHAEPARIAPGTLYVPIAQPLARLVAALLEPQAPDSFLAWGFFNAHFEEKEQIEPYVAELIAREQLAADPALGAEFARRLAADPGFAADPNARLRFFLQRHASWDGELGRYPVLRTDGDPLAGEA